MVYYLSFTATAESIILSFNTEKNFSSLVLLKYL